MLADFVNNSKALKSLEGTGISDSVISASNRKFVECEDKLFCAGLHRYGLGNWEAIRAEFLPFRSVKQLSIHFKNMTSRKSQQNILKVGNLNNIGRHFYTNYGCL